MSAVVGSNAGTHEHHHCAAARTEHRWAFLWRWCEAAGVELQQQMQQRDQAFAVLAYAVM